MYTHTDQAYMANALGKRMINSLWLYIDLIHAPYIENWKKKKRCKKIHTICLQISKFTLTLPWEGKKIPWPSPLQPCQHTLEGTSFEFKALREIPEKLAWNSVELAFPTGRLGLKPCCTGAGDLRSHWTSVGLTFLKVTQELNNPASQPHRLSPRTRRKKACKGTIWTFLITAYVHRKRGRESHTWRGIGALSKASRVNLLELGLQEFTSPSCSLLETDIILITLHVMAQAIKTQLAFDFFFSTGIPKAILYKWFWNTRQRHRGWVERQNSNKESCLGHGQRMPKPWPVAPWAPRIWLGQKTSFIYNSLNLITGTWPQLTLPLFHLWNAVWLRGRGPTEHRQAG